MKPLIWISLASLLLVGCAPKNEAAGAGEVKPDASVAQQGSEGSPQISEGDAPPVPLGQPAPDAEFVDLGGKPVKLSSLRGKVVLVDFWATWCPPCREGLPVTDKLHRKYAKDLVVLAVSDEDKQTVASFLKDFSYAFPPMLDPDAKAATIYHVQAIPTTVIIDAKGNLSSYVVGLAPEADVLANLEKAGLKL